jgi:hypothetical protein
LKGKLRERLCLLGKGSQHSVVLLPPSVELGRGSCGVRQQRDCHCDRLTQPAWRSQATDVAFLRPCRSRLKNTQRALILGSAAMTNTPAPALRIQHPPERSKFRELARMLSREDDPPAWLCRFFEDWAPSLLMDRGVHLIQPTRKEMRRRLAQVSTAVDTLTGALNDSATAGFLDPTGTESAKYAGMAAALLEVKKRAADASKSASLATPRGRTPSGRGKALLPGSFSPKVFCAAIIAEAWNLVRGGYPAPSNIEAAALANAFWEASGGPVTGSWGNDPLKAWRPSFIEAGKNHVDEIKGKIRHYLVNARHYG